MTTAVAAITRVLAVTDTGRPTVSVIVCAYTEKRWPLLVEAVASLERQTVVPFEVFLVSDHNEVLLQRMREAFPQHRVLANSYGPGLIGGRNTGFEAATGGVIAFLDDDAEAPSNWIETLLRHFDDPGTAGAGSAARPVWELGSRPVWFPEALDWTVGCSHSGMPKQATAVRNIIGCSMFFRREAIEAVGGFSENFSRRGTETIGCDDTDICIRIGQAFPTMKVIYDPSISVTQFVTEERSSVSYVFKRCVGEGKSKASIRKAHGSSTLGTEASYLGSTVLRSVARDLAIPGRGYFGRVARAAVLCGGVGAAGVAFVRASALQIVRNRKQPA